MKHFTSVADVEDLPGLIQTGLSFAKAPLSKDLKSRNLGLGMFFANPSLRTRMSTFRAAQNLGMQIQTIELSKDSWAWEFEDGAVMDGGTAEHIREAARVISEYCDIIALRNMPRLHSAAEDSEDKALSMLVKHATKPVISLESETRHPLQSLADMMTIEQHKSVNRPKVVLSWAPHPRPLPHSVSQSFCEWALRMDYDLTVTAPPGYELSAEYMGSIETQYNQKEALANADFVYVKNWSSTKDYGKVTSQDPSWTLSEEHFAATNNAHFMHCLPIRRNVVATDAVIDSPTSLIIEQARNRTFAAQAVIYQLLKDNVL